jgi:hypothetical protein
MMEAARTSETSVDNHFTRQYNPEDSSEQNSELLIVKTASAHSYHSAVKGLKHVLLFSKVAWHT